MKPKPPTIEKRLSCLDMAALHDTAACRELARVSIISATLLTLGTLLSAALTLFVWPWLDSGRYLPLGLTILIAFATANAWRMAHSDWNFYRRAVNRELLK